jgi:hypothetical protein
MKIANSLTIFALFLLAFSTISSGQEPTPKQKEIFEEMKKNLKEIREANEKEIGLGKLQEKRAAESKIEFFWQEGIGLTYKDLAQDRNLANYDDGGHFDCQDINYSPEKLSPEKLLFPCDGAKIRDFIWQHWTEKKRGYLRESSDGIDHRATSHWFIEPNKENQWSVNKRTVYCGVGGCSINDWPQAILMEQIEDKDKSDKWILVLKSSKGKIIWQF